MPPCTILLILQCIGKEYCSIILLSLSWVSYHIYLEWCLFTLHGKMASDLYFLFRYWQCLKKLTMQSLISLISKQKLSMLVQWQVNKWGHKQCCWPLLIWQSITQILSKKPIVVWPSDFRIWQHYQHRQWWLKIVNKHESEESQISTFYNSLKGLLSPENLKKSEFGSRFREFA